jgi:hypothetical protein
MHEILYTPKKVENVWEAMFNNAPEAELSSKIVDALD